MADVAVTNIPSALTFLLDDTQLVGIIETTAVYPLNGISQANSRFYFKITDLNGDIIYQNSAFNSTPDYTDPDILGASGTTWVNTPPTIPTTSDGEVVKGQYTVYLKQRDQSQVVTDIFTENYTVDYQYDSPVLTFEKSIQLFNPPQILVTDVTNYAIKDYLTGEQSNPILQTRAWNLYYPPSLQFSPITSTGVSVQAQNVWSGNYEVVLSTALRYLLSSSLSGCHLSIWQTLDLTDAFGVPKTNENQFYCCLKTAENRYYSSIGTEAEMPNLVVFNTVSAYETLILTAIRNGSYDKVATYIERARKLANCDDDCECNDDDAPEQLTGWGTQVIPYDLTDVAPGGSASTFPLTETDRNALKNKTLADFMVFDGELYVPTVSNAGSYITSFNSTSGTYTLNYVPTAGNIISTRVIK